MVGVIFVVLMAGIGVVSAEGVWTYPWESGAGVTPSLESYPMSCPAGTDEYKLDYKEYTGSGLYGDDDFKVNVNLDVPYDVSFTGATELVQAVILKNGNCLGNPTGACTNLYEYDPAVTADTLLSVPPMDYSEKDGYKFGDVSHISFCYTGSEDVPEFPTLALPVAMIIGFLGLILFVRGTKEN